MTTPDETNPPASSTRDAEAAPPAATSAEVRTPSSETDRSKLEKNKAKKQKPEPTTALGRFWVWISPIVKVVLVVWLVRTAIIDWNDVPTGSMEPNILVGDRILVNKAAYAFQLPLSGPKIGVPFTPLQWDNPLDFLPQFQWGTPVRGDNVTFWNPVTGVRMVKRIVAQPGDTVEMKAGKLIINGQEAKYVDVTPFPPETTKFEVGVNAGQRGQSTQIKIEPLESLMENILGQERKIQHIKTRWGTSPKIAVYSDGKRPELQPDGRIIIQRTGQRMTPEEIATTDNVTFKLLQIKDGELFVDDDSVSYNDYAAAMLAPMAGEKVVVLGNGTVLGIRGHELLIDGEPTSHSLFFEAVKNELRATQTNPDRKTVDLYERIDHLDRAMSTNFGPVSLGDDQYYMIGDNRQNSHDSRFFGPVDRGEITGEAVAIAASFDGRILQIPPEPRWSRWFSDLD